MTLIIIGATVLGTLVVLAVVPAIVHRFIGPVLAERVAQSHTPERVLLRDLQALSFGLESKGVTQMRGNGALVLTAQELHFFQLVPKSEIRIPLAAITEGKTVRSHLGKTSGRDLFYVSFVVDGKEDSVAWYVTDVQAWLAKLTHARGSDRGE